MKTLLYLVLMLGCAGAFAADERDRLGTVDFKKSTYARALGKLTIRSPTKKYFITDCTAFLVGSNLLATAAHCLRFGLESATFCLHYQGDKDPKCAAEAKLVGMHSSGGGLGKNDELWGWDWAIATLDKPLGDQFIDGKKVGWLEFSHGSVGKEGSNLRVYSYMGDWPKDQEGEFLAFQRAKVKYPPKAAQQWCYKPRTEGGKYECNFIQLENYIHSLKGEDSGAPVISDESGKVVAIMVGRSVDGNYAWGATVNESRDGAGSVAVHWEQLRVFQRFTEIMKVLKNRRLIFPEDDANKLALVKHYRETAESWYNSGEDNDSSRFARIQHWDTPAALEFIHEVNEEVLTRVKAQPGGMGVFVGIPATTLDKVHAGVKKFGRFYEITETGVDKTKVATPMSEKNWLAAREKMLKDEETSIEELKKKRDEIKKTESGGSK